MEHLFTLVPFVQLPSKLLSILSSNSIIFSSKLNCAGFISLMDGKPSSCIKIFAPLILTASRSRPSCLVSHPVHCWAQALCARCTSLSRKVHLPVGAMLTKWAFQQFIEKLMGVAEKASIDNPLVLELCLLTSAWQNHFSDEKYVNQRTWSSATTRRWMSPVLKWRNLTLKKHLSYSRMKKPKCEKRWHKTEQTNKQE